MWGDFFESPKPTVPRIDLTALIDVIFILLIFFMVSTTFTTQGIPVKLSKSGTSSQLPSVILRIVIEKDGVLQFEGRVYTDEQLSVQLRQQFRKNVTVVLYPDRLSRTGDLVRVMDLCRREGITAISIATDPQ